MATKPEREVASHEKMLSTKLRNPLIRWAPQVTWRIKNVLSPFPADLWLLNGMVAYDKKQQTEESHGLLFTWSREVT